MDTSTRNPNDSDSSRVQPQLSGRSPLSSLMGVKIASIGSYAPDEIVRNEDLAELGYDSDWIVQRTGIRQRRRAAPDQATSDLAYEAAVRCLDKAGLAVADVDLILVATMTPDMPTPSTACNVQRLLGSKAPAMDINAACSGFIYALVTGMQFIRTKTCRHVLVIGSDVMTRAINPADQKTFPLFGDGAGAALLSAGSEDQGLIAYTLGAEGDGGQLLSQPGGGTREPLTPELLAAGRQYIRMDGRAVFKWAIRLIVDSVWDVLRYAGRSIEDIDLVACHQANIRIIEAAAKDLELDPGRVYTNLERYGNTTGGSIPLVLDEAINEGRVAAGKTILICGFGAGLTWGTGLFRW